jgi:hypothetical protein
VNLNSTEVQRLFDQLCRHWPGLGIYHDIRDLSIRVQYRPTRGNQAYELHTPEFYLRDIRDMGVFIRTMLETVENVILGYHSELIREQAAGFQYVATDLATGRDSTAVSILRDRVSHEGPTSRTVSTPAPERRYFSDIIAEELSRSMTREFDRIAVDTLSSQRVSSELISAERLVPTMGEAASAMERLAQQLDREQPTSVDLVRQAFPTAFKQAATHKDAGKAVKPARLQRSLLGVSVEDIRQPNGSLSRLPAPLEPDKLDPEADHGYEPCPPKK